MRRPPDSSSDDRSTVLCWRDRHPRPLLNVGGISGLRWSTLAKGPPLAPASGMTPPALTELSNFIDGRRIRGCRLHDGVRERRDITTAPIARFARWHITQTGNSATSGATPRILVSATQSWSAVAAAVRRAGQG